MNESSWVGATRPSRMTDWVMCRASARKLRLLAVGCCRRLAGLGSELRLVEAITATERYADAISTAEDLEQAHTLAIATNPHPGWWAAQAVIALAASADSFNTWTVISLAASAAQRRAERVAQCAL